MSGFPGLLCFWLFALFSSIFPLFSKADSNSSSNNSIPEGVEIAARIVGGSYAQIGRWKYYAVSTRNALCGATLIHKDVLLTAAHCLNAFQISADEYGVIVGSYIRNRVVPGSARRRVANVTTHPAYSNWNLKNDFMLVRFHEPVNQIDPVSLNSEFSVPLEEERVIALGFGATREGGSVSTYLRFVEVNALTLGECQAQYGNSVSDDVMICAGVDQGGKDSCQGDSGGPLLRKDGTQVGVVSFGIGCGRATHAGVYARVSAAKDWIEEQLCSFSKFPPSSCFPTPPPTHSPTKSPTSVPTRQPTPPPSEAPTTGRPTARPTTARPTPSRPPTPNHARIKVVLKYDHQPWQTWWEIHQEGSSDRFFKGPTLDPDPNATVPTLWGAFPLGWSRITIHDTAWNGIARDDEYLTIVQILEDGSEHGLVTSSKKFFVSDTVRFFVSASGESPPPTQEPTGAPTDQPTLRPTPGPTHTPTDHPSLRPTPQPQPTHRRVRFEVKYDWNHLDISFDISRNGELLYHGPQYQPTRFKRWATVFPHFPTGTFEFTIYDEGCNGMWSWAGRGDFDIFMELENGAGDVLLLAGNHDFECQRTETFVVP